MNTAADPSVGKVSDAGLFHALELDGLGSAKALDWGELRKAGPLHGPVWVYLDRKEPGVHDWLYKESGLPESVCEALLEEETRPRALTVGNGVLLFLRGVNLNAGAEPDDMISFRVWIEEHRIISLRFAPLAAIGDVRKDLETGHGPKTICETLVAIVARITERMTPVLANIDDIIDDLEEQVMQQPDKDLRQDLVKIRRQAITLRRFIGPQRDAINQLQTLKHAWLDDDARFGLREKGDRITRIVEDLDAIRERAAVVQEEVSNHIGEKMNRNMYLLSIVAGIFLPLGFLTGLLGINVGGMPGVDNPHAFTLVCIILAALGALGFWLFKRKRML